MTLTEEIKNLPFTEEDIAQAFFRLGKGGKMVMEDNAFEHLCVYTLPYHAESKQVLLGHHIKADKWLVPGGHIDRGETIKQTAIREVAEELGAQVIADDISEPFFVDLTPILNSKPPRVCALHFNIWVHFSVPTNTFVLDESEFYESKWMALNEAIEKTTDRSNKDALSKFLNPNA